MRAGRILPDGVGDPELMTRELAHKILAKTARYWGICIRNLASGTPEYFVVFKQRRQRTRT
jgi:hypothetical protein